MSKLNKLITNWPTSLIYTTSHLRELGYSPALLAKYKKSNWVVEIGKGAIGRKGDPLDWRGAVTALQKQLNLQIHVAARTALKLHGVTHFLRGAEPLILFAPLKTKLPTWFKEKDWGQKINFYTTKLFKSDLGIVRHNVDDFSFRVSTKERALFEQLYLVPKHASFEESAYLFEGLQTLRHELIQELLSECHSIKVKRLFMVIAEELKYPWLSKLDLTGIDFGKGNRSIDRGGTTNSKYKITTKLPFAF